MLLRCEEDCIWSAEVESRICDIVYCFYQVFEYAIVPGGDLLRKIDSSVAKPSNYYLGLAGMPTLTAWAGFTCVEDADVSEKS